MSHNLNLQKLIEGSTFLNFKELSEFLGFKTPPAGNSKKKLIKELNSFCNYEKSGHKYIIIEIFDTPKEISDARKNKVNRENNSTKGIYKSDIQQLLIYLLSSKPLKETFYFTPSNLLKDIGLITNKFEYTNHYSSKEISFYLSTKKKQRLLLESALNDLSNKKHITYSQNYFVVLNKKYSNIDSRLATPEELTLIAQAEEKVLIDLGYSTKQALFKNSPKRINQFFSLCNSKINELTSGFITQFYTVYEISLLRDKSILTPLEFKNIKTNLNKKRAQYLSDNLKNHNNLIKKSYDSKMQKELSSKQFITESFRSRIINKYDLKYKTNHYSDKDKKDYQKIIDKFFISN